MSDGRFVQIGTYRELYNNPANLFVGGFIGTPLMNEFRGRASQGRWQGRTFGGFPIRKDLEDGALITLGRAPGAYAPWCLLAASRPSWSA